MTASRTAPYLYWDTSVFIPLFTAAELERRAIAERLLVQAQGGGAEIVTSVFTIAEARRDPGRPPAAASSVSAAAQFFALRIIVMVPLNRRIAMAAASIGERYGLKPPDAVHLATALDVGAERLLTWDDGFFRGVLRDRAPLPIERPA